MLKIDNTCTFISQFLVAKETYTPHSVLHYSTDHPLFSLKSLGMIVAGLSLVATN